MFSIILFKLSGTSKLSLHLRMAVILDTPGFCMEKVFYCSDFGLCLNDFNFYKVGKKYVLSAILVK